MKSISTEKRLQLIRLIRDEHARNTGQLRRREEILYDAPIFQRSRNNYEEKENIADGLRTIEGEEYVRPPSTLKMRALISLLIGMSFLYLDVQGQEIYGISAVAVREYIAQEDEIHILALEIEALLKDSGTFEKNP